MRDDDIDTEYPVDVDDEHVPETRFLSGMPAEFTHLSCALALFGAARVLNKVLDQLYPSTGSEISLSHPCRLTDELDAWFEALPPHLRLEFEQGKPSTNMTSNRSPLLVSSIPVTRNAIANLLRPWCITSFAH
jgi:hypothetical protein